MAAVDRPRDPASFAVARVGETETGSTARYSVNRPSMTKARGIWVVTPASRPSIETAKMACDQFLPWIRSLEKGRDLSRDLGSQTIHDFERMVSFHPEMTAPTTIGNPLRFGTLAGPPPEIRVQVTIAGAPKEEQEGWLSAVGVRVRLIPWKVKRVVVLWIHFNRSW